jgi:glutaredoxin 3
MADQKQVTIYSTPTCHFCHAAKDFFTANHIEFTDFNVASDLTKRQEMIQKSGQMGVPVIDIGGELVVGFDEEKLRELLHVAAA